MLFKYGKVISMIMILVIFLSACQSQDATSSSSNRLISVKTAVPHATVPPPLIENTPVEKNPTATDLPAQTMISSTPPPEPISTSNNRDISIEATLSESLTSTVSTIERIKERGNKLIAGVKYDFKPFGFINQNGQVTGFDVDLIQAMADEWGVEVEFAQVTSGNRIQKLAAGEVDLLAASMTHKKERDEIIDFSQTYFLDGQSLLVRRDSRINGIAELDGKTVSAIEGSTSIDQIQAYADANNIQIELFPFLEYPPAIESLKAGAVDALTTDSVALYQFAQDSPELVVVGELFTKEPYGMGLPSGDSYFNNLVNFTLQKLKKEGIYDQLYQKWFGKQATPYPIELLPGQWPYTFATSPTTLDQPIQSTIDRIISQNRFVAGVKHDVPPFGFFNEQSQLVGFDVDLIREFAKRWLGDENAVEFVQVTSSNRIPKLIAGEVDILAASMTHNQERDEEIDFSQTYFLDEQSVVGKQFTSEPYGLGVPNYDDHFRDLVNFTLQEMKLDGTYDRLYEKWFGDYTPYNIEIWPGKSYLAINTIPMLRIPAGDFRRGNQNGFPNEGPEQVITLDEFYIDQYEVTNRLYQQCVAEEICLLPKIERSVSFADYYASPSFGNYPVVWVTWQDAQTYCEFAGKRLPTEAEWEKAARGALSDHPNGISYLYPWGDEPPTAENKYANSLASNNFDTMPVGSYPAGMSLYGVHDMAGNVREWVADWYQRDYYQDGPQKNPLGPIKGVTKIVRGGAWNDVALDLTTTRRKDFLSESYDAGLGFRCASSDFPPMHGE